MTVRTGWTRRRRGRNSAQQDGPDATRRRRSRAVQGGPRTGSVAVTATLALLIGVLAGPSATAADPAGPPSAVPVPIAAPAGLGTTTDPKIANPENSGTSQKFNGALQHAPRGVQRVFVELRGNGAVHAATETLAKGLATANARGSADSERAATAATSDAVMAAAKAVDPAAAQLFEVTNAVPGLG